MLARFIRYYKPHLRLFFLDIAAAILGSLLLIVVPFLTRRLIQVYLPENNVPAITTILAIMFVLILVSVSLMYIRVRWGHVLGVRIEFDMRADFFAHIQKLSFSYFDNVKTGHLVSRISNDLNLIAEIAHHAPEDLVISVCMIAGAFVAMFAFSAKLATIAIIPLVAMVLWGVFYGGMMRRGFRRVRKRIADINSSVENSVQGIREVKAFANEQEEIEKFDCVNVSFKTAKEDMYGIMAIFFSGMSFLTETYYFVVVGAGVILINMGQITTADLIAFILYIHLILRPIQRLVNFTEQFQQGSACFERFIEVMDIMPDIVDSKDAISLEKIDGKVEISELSFKYSSGSEFVLKNINMNIAAHKTVAIVGQSGAGKSTIVSLIPRFYEPTFGSIKIDGVDIMNLKQKFLRENIGIVQQNVFLFDSTVRENIIYGKLDATQDQLIDAAKKANIYDFIMSLPDGFDTLVGERGVKLSGGEKQRISIARVFLKDPPIFIFDEATSSLDTESESLIQNSLDLLSRGRTTIIIAHRLSTVRNADYLYVLREGEIVEQGKHSELLEIKGYYHSLYNMNVF